MSLLLLVGYVAVGPFAGSFANDFPSHLPRCYIDDLQIGNCMVNATRILQDRVRQGIEEIGIPSYDPLVIPTFSIHQESDMVNYTSVFWNYTIRGMDYYDITAIQYNSTTTTFSGKLDFDPLSIDSVYIFNGRLLFIPICGSGTAQAALGPINGTFEITGNIVSREADEYYNLTGVKIRLTFDDMSMYLNGLFDGNLEEEIMTNELLNRHSKMVIDAVTPALEQISEEFIFRYLKWLTDQFSFYKLFPRSGDYVSDI